MTQFRVLFFQERAESVGCNIKRGVRVRGEKGQTG